MDAASPSLKRRRVSIDNDDHEAHSSCRRCADPPAIHHKQVLAARELAGSVSLLTRTTSGAPARQSPDLWMDDGSVVLQAEDVQFKVHRSVLCRHSPIFRDVFGMPHPKGEPTIDGCPVLLLQDSAQDVKHMLMSFYDKGHSTRDPLPFDVVAAMIRMGRKYDIDYLREEALLRLTMEFPTTLDEWDKLPQDYTQIHHQSGILFDIVNLAHENDVKSILPAAYYLCIQEFEDLLLGSKRDDGSTSQVSWEVKRECVLGRDRILRAQSEHLFKWIDQVGKLDKCTQSARCHAAAAGLTKAIWVPMPEPARTLEKWHEFTQVVPNYVKDLCLQCQYYARVTHEEGRQQIWRHLPSYFGLPGWNDLKNFDT